MQPKLKEAIKSMIDSASGFVLNHTGCTLSDEQVYEELIGEPHVLAAFRNAVQYLPKADFAKYVDIDYAGREVRVCLRFNASARYPTYFIPTYKLRVNEGTKLYDELTLGVQLATDWQKLYYVTQRILNELDNAEIASFLLPWLRYLDLDCTAEKKADQRFIDREIKIIKSRPFPRQFPALTRDITAICNSGKQLFSQMRMLQSGVGEDAWTAMPRMPISVCRSVEMVPEWVSQQMETIMLDWRSRLIQ
jgi:hypothetical protein